MKTNQKL